MKNGRILDCTLRDGAYLINKDFGKENIEGIINGLIQSNIDIIEIGFLQDEGFGEGKTVFLNGEDAKKYIPKDKKNKMFTVLADYSRYSIKNLDFNTGQSFDAVRACFFKKERFEVIKFCSEIKRKGYKVFVQPVDILGYTDKELLELIDSVNTIEPYCFSIVDTFGSMYADDLIRVYNLIENNLVETSAIGFHSHNNLQMSNSLSQEFLRILKEQRNGIVDTTISGMGRGAGNTPTELVAQYMNTRLGYSYDLDALLDIIDNYMENIKSKCTWGYSTEFFIAGCYSAHVNNIAYLKKKNSILSKDMRFILNKLSTNERKRYDYELLDKIYINYLKSDIDDQLTLDLLKKIIHDRNVVIIAPGKSIKLEKEKVKDYIKKNNAIVIGINFVNDDFKNDFIYFSNMKRYRYWKDSVENIPKIVTSNILQENSENTYIVSFIKLVKCGWIHFDNSSILLLRLLDMLGASSIGIAGLDGYDMNSQNYVSNKLEMANSYDDPIELNREISDMLTNFLETKKNKEMTLNFITTSRFDK